MKFKFFLKKVLFFEALTVKMTSFSIQTTVFEFKLKIWINHTDSSPPLYDINPGMVATEPGQWVWPSVETSLRQDANFTGSKATAKIPKSALQSHHFWYHFSF
jgi:hypothetical protein